MVEDAWGGWDEGLDDDECWSVEDEVPWREEDDKFSPTCSDSEKKANYNIGNSSRHNSKWP